MTHVIDTPSLATGQRSLAPQGQMFPLVPAQLKGCPATGTAEFQYPLEVTYDYGRARPLRFAPGAGWADWAQLLPPRHPLASLPVGKTPLTDVSALAPGQHQGRRIFVKDESRNPTWSHKDRLNTFTISAALYEGAHTIIVASSGNHGVSAAALASRAGLNCIVLTMPGVSGAFREMIHAYGALPLYLQADDRWPAMRVLQGLPGVYPVSNLTPVHTGHPWGPEGYKTIAYEILSDLDGTVPAAVVVPTGYGEMLFGIWKGFREAMELGRIPRLPRLISVEPAARGPLFHALAANRPAVTVPAGETVQSGTGTTVNSYRAVLAMRESQGLALLVDDASALEAHRRLARQGLWLEVSSGAALAALDQVGRFEDEGPIILIGCSTGLKEPAPVPGALPQAVSPDLPAMRRRLKADYGLDL